MPQRTPTSSEWASAMPSSALCAAVSFRGLVCATCEWVVNSRLEPSCQTSTGSRKAAPQVRFVVGDFGSGKSFLLGLARELALSTRLVVASADLTTSRRLHSSSSQAQSLYTELMSSLATRAAEWRGHRGDPPTVRSRLSGAARATHDAPDDVIRRNWKPSNSSPAAMTSLRWSRRIGADSPRVTTSGARRQCGGCVASTPQRLRPDSPWGCTRSSTTPPTMTC